MRVMPVLPAESTNVLGAVLRGMLPLPENAFEVATVPDLEADVGLGLVPTSGEGPAEFSASMLPLPLAGSANLLGTVRTGGVELQEPSLEPAAIVDLEAEPGLGVDGTSGATPADISAGSSCSGCDQAASHAHAEGDTQCQASNHVSPCTDRVVFPVG